jgi:hypothetical protein
VISRALPSCAPPPLRPRSWRARPCDRR